MRKIQKMLKKFGQNTVFDIAQNTNNTKRITQSTVFGIAESPVAQCQPCTVRRHIDWLGSAHSIKVFWTSAYNSQLVLRT